MVSNPYGRVIVQAALDGIHPAYADEDQDDKGQDGAQLLRLLVLLREAAQLPV